MKVENIRDCKISVPHGGGVLIAQTVDGEVHELELTAGKYPGKIFDGIEDGATITLSDGVKLIRLNLHRVKRRRATDEIHFASGANPDFVPASGTEAEIKALKAMVGGLVAKEKRRTEDAKLAEAAQIRKDRAAEAKAKAEAEAAAAAAEAEAAEAEKLVETPSE